MTNQEYRSSAAHLLVVDDEVYIREILLEILETTPHRAEAAADGKEALQKWAHQLYDLMIVDLRMPGMDGETLIREIRKTDRDIALIVLTGHGELAHAYALLKEYQISDFLYKPLEHPAQLLFSVENALEKRRLRQQSEKYSQQLAEVNAELKQMNDQLELRVQERTVELSSANEQLKNAIEIRKQSERQYRLLIENVDSGIGIIQEEKLVFVNDALASILDSTKDWLVGRSPVDILQNDYKAQFRKTLEQLRQNGSVPQRWPIFQGVMREDNREIWMEWRHSMITWEGNPAILMDMRDITQRKLREMAIEEERNSLQKENLQLKATMKERYRFGDIIGKSQAMQKVYELILKAAASEKNVLICGDSGTGKELIARTIHHLSGCQGKAFVPVNCGAIPETLFEREFFGHRKGAFTGADRDKQGFFDAAHQGTLFLDEVAELSLTMQVKLLRVIESREYTPLGDSKPKTSNVRIIAATHRNLTDQIIKGMMREDFFYRIHVIVITVPPLRHRKEDIPLLVDHFLETCSENKKPPALSGRALEALYNYDWPGNIRQLQNTISRYLTVGTLDFISPRGVESVEKGDMSDTTLDQKGMPLHEAVEQLEKRMILSVLKQQRWHRIHTAAQLGIPRRTLLRKMKKYGIT